MKDHPDVVVSGGWDKTLKFFDLWEGTGPFGHIFGPELSSNALDSNGNFIVSGSYRALDSL